MSLKNRIFIVVFMLSVIPAVLIAMYTYNRYTDLIGEQTESIAGQILRQGHNKIETNVTNMMNITERFNFYTSDEHSVLSELKKFTVNKEYSAYEIFESNKNLLPTFQEILYTYDYINGIYVFTAGGAVLGRSSGVIDVRSDYNPREDNWYQETLTQKDGLYVNGISDKEFLINSSESISFSQALYDVHNREFLGVVFIDCSPSVVDINEINSLPSIINLVVTDSFGNTLYNNIEGETSAPSHIDTAHTSGNLAVKLYIDYDRIFEQFDTTQIILISLATLSIIVSFGLSMFVSRYISVPITHLSHRLENQRSAEFIPTKKFLDRKDEIGSLYKGYNNMAQALNDYIKKEYQNKLIVLDSQMKSLESQINSHFLYNTLESINSIAEVEEVEEISTMSLALGNMFRYSIKTQSELVTIADELQHVKDYISIQKIRFADRFHIKINITDEMLNLKILKLILQPLVENALFHGLNHCHVGSKVVINAHVDESDIFFSVVDDGVGIEKNKLDELRAKLMEKPKFTELGHRNNSSIGIINIHTRIVLYYGEGYGIFIDSIPGCGSSFTIRLPRR